MQNNNVVCADCLETLKKMKTEKIDLIYLDPPFFTQNIQSLVSSKKNEKFSFCDKWKDMDEYLKFMEVRLEECKSIPKNKNWVEIFFCGVGSAGFCYLFGGTALDSFVAFFIGLVLQIFLIASDRHLESKFITNILGSGIVTFLSLIVLSAGIPILQDKVVIGDIMPLVPGIALTTSIRDFFNGDYLSGAIHMIDAILTAFSIAVGVGAVITLYQLVTGGALLR